MKILKKVMLIVIVFALCITAAPIQTQAASSKNKKAHKAYLKQIKKDKKKYRSGKEKLKYAYKDLNGDGIDELITEPEYGYCSQIIYTYKGGKVKKLVEVGQGEFMKYYKKNKVLYYYGGHGGSEYDEYYKLQNNKYKCVAHKDVEFDWNMETEEEIYTTSYYVKGKKVDKKVYTSYIKKLTKGDKAKSFRKIKRKKY